MPAFLSHHWISLASWSFYNVNLKQLHWIMLSKMYLRDLYIFFLQICNQWQVGKLFAKGFLCFIYLFMSERITFTFMHLADAFIQSDLHLHSGYTFSLVHVFPGNRTHNLLRCWRNALPLSHTGIRHSNCFLLIFFAHIWHFYNSSHIMIQNCNSAVGKLCASQK